MKATVREVQQEVRIDLKDAPPLRCAMLGHQRKVYGLRISYGRGADVERIDLTIEHRDSAHHWSTDNPMPAWLADIIREHQPADVSEPAPDRRRGMGSLMLPELASAA